MNQLDETARAYVGQKAIRLRTIQTSGVAVKAIKEDQPALAHTKSKHSGSPQEPATLLDLFNRIILESLP